MVMTYSSVCCCKLNCETLFSPGGTDEYSYTHFHLHSLGKKTHQKLSGRFELQSTLVISKSKGPSKTVRDIRTSTYQICSIEEKTI